MRRNPTIPVLILLGALCCPTLLFLPGCSAFRSYPERVRYAQNAFADADYEEAAYALKKVSPARRDKLCFLLELGTLYHTMGDYAAGNEAFLDAVEIAREFDERALISLRDSAAFAASLVVNDKMRPYRGEPFERVLLHSYLAMNFLLQHDLENARVEILQAYARQKEAREQHAKRIARTKEEAEKKKLDTSEIISKVRGAYADQRDLLKKAGNVYQNAFTYYLSALVYELNGEISDAYIDVKTVHALNPNFLPARRDLLRYSRMLGLRGDYEKWRQEFGKGLEDCIPEGHGEVVLLFQCGLAPVKEEIKVGVPVPIKEHVNIITIALPKYRSRSNPVRAARLWGGGKELGTTQTLMDVEATAVRNLWDQALAIGFRHVVRSMGRLAATEYAKRKLGGLLYVPFVLLGHAIEQADLRSWISLPRNFQALRASLPAGSHKLELELLGSGASRRITLADVPVREGGLTFISLRSTRNLGTAKYVVF